MYIFDSTQQKMDNLNDRMDKHVTVVFFLAPWCKFCKDLKPKLESVQNSFKNSKLDGTIASVSENHITNLKYKKTLKGYPTISLFKDGEYKDDYNGPREKSALRQYLLDIFKKNQQRSPENISISKSISKKGKKGKKGKKRKSKKTKKSLIQLGGKRRRGRKRRTRKRRNSSKRRRRKRR